MWAGVDVGGRRKGFHAAVVGRASVAAGPTRLPTAEDAVDWIAEHEPSLVAVDSPRSPAASGSRSRPEERAIVRSVCGIRYTPDSSLLEGNPYYEWIVAGFELYAELERRGFAAIECFPTASWTRWAGARGTRTRASWSAAALAGRGLAGLRDPLSQDDRDAIGAALTARCYALGSAESFGEIVVPR